MNHMPWDDGAITGIFGKVLEQKTVRSLCGKRVQFACADPNAPITCHECAVKILDRQAGMELVFKHAEHVMRKQEGVL